MKNYMKMLARKGEVTIVESAGRNTTVAIRSSGNVMTLQARVHKDQLIAELYQLCKNWPDMLENND